jgi:SAM-dependent methyltransferase
MLVSRPEMRQALGDRAQRWVERECNWPLVAERYVEFVAQVSSPVSPAVAQASRPVSPVEQVSRPVLPSPPVDPTYIQSWAPDLAAEKYVDEHLDRLTKTLEITPAATTPADRILEMGAYLQITPALKNRLGYGEVRCCYYGRLGQVEHRKIVSADGEEFECDIELFNAEKDRFPYDDGYFSTVLCCELIEHLNEDPMHLVAEVNRILKPGGHFVLTTPNIGSLRAISAVLQGYHPGFFPAYIKASGSGFVDARHNREYTPKEVWRLLLDGGFERVLLETGPFREGPRPEYEWVLHLLDQYYLSKDLRGDGIYAVGRKKGPVRERYPAWLYQ